MMYVSLYDAHLHADGDGSILWERSLIKVAFLGQRSSPALVDLCMYVRVQEQTNIKNELVKS